MNILSELFQDASHSTIQGMFGVTGIFVYFCVIVGAALYRINELKKSDHH